VARTLATATPLAGGNVLVAGGSGGTLGTPTYPTSGELFTFSSKLFGLSPLSSIARSRHSATLLPDGTVLLAGGHDGGGVVQGAEIFTPPPTSTFSPTPNNLGTARQRHTATLLTGGNVLVAGGNDGTLPLASAEIYSFTGTTFAPTGNLITARFGAGAAFLPNGKVLVAGGTGVGPAALASAELFDPQDGLIPSAPSATLTVPSSATLNQTGLTASVPSQSGVTYVWTLSGGTLTSGLGTNAVTFDVGTANAVLNVLVISDRQLITQGTATILVGP
jgi:hypothetical protein